MPRSTRPQSTPRSPDLPIPGAHSTSLVVFPRVRSPDPGSPRSPRAHFLGSHVSAQSPHLPVPARSLDVEGLAYPSGPTSCSPTFLPCVRDRVVLGHGLSLGSSLPVSTFTPVSSDVSPPLSSVECATSGLPRSPLPLSQRSHPPAGVPPVDDLFLVNTPITQAQNRSRSESATFASQLRGKKHVRGDTSRSVPHGPPKKFKLLSPMDVSMHSVVSATVGPSQPHRAQ